MSRLRIALKFAALSCIALSSFANADLLFDRGLPTANLNNAAGANRSNVGWGFSEDWFFGDTFSIGGSGPAGVSTIRTWIVGGNTQNFGDLYSSLSFWLGSGANSNLTNTSFSFTASLVTYAGGSTYQGSGGGFRNIWQIDWDTSGLVLDTNTTYSFGVSGVTTAAGTSALGYQNIVYLHSSNAGLSGSTQEGADGLLNAYAPGGVYDSTFSSLGNGWDKSSDANIQIFGSQPVPEPFTMMLGAAGLGVAIRRKLRKQKE